MTNTQPPTTLPPKTEIPELMYVHTVAERLCCSTRKIYTLIQENEIEAVRLGKRGVRVVKSSVVKYLERGQLDPEEYFR